MKTFALIDENGDQVRIEQGHSIDRLEQVNGCEWVLLEEPQKRAYRDKEGVIRTREKRPEERAQKPSEDSLITLCHEAANDPEKLEALLLRLCRKRGIR